MGINLYVNIITKDSSGGAEYIVGSAPLIEILNWNSTAQIDKAGTFSFSCMATSNNLINIQRLRKIRAYAFINDAYVEIGNGIIDTIDTNMTDKGAIMSVSGSDMLSELSYKSVQFLDLSSSSSPVSHSTALTSIAALAPAGWTMTADPTPPNNYIYRKFGGDSVLSALVYLAESTRTHFALNGFRTLRFLSDAEDSGILITGSEFGNANNQTCGIKNIKKRQTSGDLITRIYPFGSGNSEARITLANTDRTAPAGYTLDAANNFIKNDSYETNYDRIEKHIQYNEIAPSSYTEANVLSASNQLFDKAFYELESRITAFESSTYDIELIGCTQILKPLQYVTIKYFDPSTGLAIDGQMWIVSSSINVDSSGITTTKITVSDEPVVERSETDVLLQAIQGLSHVQALKQLRANQYSVPLNGTITDANTIISVPISLNTEMVKIKSVTIYFKPTGTFPLSDLAVGKAYLGGSFSGYALSSATSIGSGWYQRDLPLDWSVAVLSQLSIKKTSFVNNGYSTVFEAVFVIENFI